ARAPPRPGIEARRRAGPAASPAVLGICALPSPSPALEDVGRVVGKTRALTAYERDVARVLPAPEAVHDISEARGRLRQVRSVDLCDVAQAHELGARARARHQRLHLLRRQVLRLIEDQEAVEERAPAHEVE